LDVEFGEKQHMTAEQRSMVEERHEALALVNERHLFLTSEYGAEATCGVGGTPLGDGLSITTVE
jgi:hypothetical protein